LYFKGRGFVPGRKKPKLNQQFVKHLDASEYLSKDSLDASQNNNIAVVEA
jgi:hypothetical protein